MDADAETNPLCLLGTIETCKESGVKGKRQVKR
jgi:hypothetical protein